MSLLVDRLEQLRTRVGLVAGPLVFALLCLLEPIEGLDSIQHRALALSLWMAIWWMSAAVHMSVTALLPLGLLPLLSVSGMDETAEHYASPIIFLFMGGFMMAQAMQRWGLHERIALSMIRLVGVGPRSIIAGFMLATAFLSMWISNTATTVMILPMALAIIREFRRLYPDDTKHSFAKALMLAVAYSASIGGISTLIGTPPNLILAGQLRRLLPEQAELQFVNWMFFGLPTALGFLLMTWAYLTRVVLQLPSGPGLGKKQVCEQLAKLGGMRLPELLILVIFSLTALAWMTRADLNIGSFHFQGWQSRWQLAGVHDGTVAMFFALVMFVTPIGGGDFLLDWDSAKKLPWEIILLLGGGFALADSFAQTGLATWVSSYLHVLGHLPLWLCVLLLCLFTTFLTEITSNTATATVLIPILISLATAWQLPPLLIAVPVTLSASCAFMLPVATPPNAIVFASGELTAAGMSRAGFVLNILGAAWITFMSLTLGYAVL